jgi:predicted PurR-regulated permease PerM
MDTITSIMGVCIALLGVLLTVVSGIFKYVHSRLISDINDLKDQQDEDKKMLNGRIDRVKEDHKKYVEKQDERLRNIDLKLERILTILTPNE